MPDILGVGELLWDVFPHAKKLGGAPANFVYHCRQLGHDGLVVSRIGADELGRELLAELKTKGVPAEGIQMDDTYPTGTVTVELTDAGHRFHIAQDVAWDRIELTGPLLESTRAAKAMCFGSLAQRSDVSRRTIHELVRQCEGLIVCDINLRQQFYSREIVRESLNLADVLKLNDEELFELNDLLGLQGRDLRSIARELISECAVELVCVTRGADGAVLVTSDQTVEHVGIATEVVDTVGCGDAFCAVLVDGLLREKPLAAICEHANRVGAFVASCPGATPAWPAELKAAVSG